MTLIRQIRAAAKRAFGTPGSNERLSGSDEGLEQLKKLAIRLTPEDVHLNHDTIAQSSLSWPPFAPSAPTSFIPIDHQEEFSMGIFVVRNNSRIPLHDHPDMYGIVKVLMGSITIKSYTPLPIDGKKYIVPNQIKDKVDRSQFKRLVPTTYNGTRTITADSNELACLDPDTDNVHEIQALGTAAFLDILAPPYDEAGGRDCRYYSIVGTVNDPEAKMDITWLLDRGTNSPEDFWTDSLAYKGPSVH